MKNLTLLIPLALFFIGGCGNSETPKDDSGLRSELNKKEIDYGNTPPEQRAQVLALMKANGAAAKAAELETKWGMKK